MPSSWYWKSGFIAFVAILALWLLVPSYFYFKLPPVDRNDPAKLEALLPKWSPPARYKLNLGLDLQGGVHLVLGVDVDQALQTKVVHRADQLLAYAKEKGFETVTAVPQPRDHRILVNLPDKATAEKFEPIAVEAYGDMYRYEWTDNGFVLAFQDQYVTRYKDDSVEQTIKSIRNRIDRWGVTEPEVRKRGGNAILIQLPGYKDPEKAKELLGKTAQLEFKIVDDEDKFLDDLKDLPEGVTREHETVESPTGSVTTAYLKAKDRALLEKAVEGKLPPDHELGTSCIHDKLNYNKCEAYRTYLLKSKVELTGDSVSDAHIAYDQSPGSGGRPYVALQFDVQGAHEFERVTGDNIKRRMAIILDKDINSAPVIQSKIAGGNAQITMGGMRSHQEILQEASDLVLVLKAGALPAPVKIEEERTVGASLGPELIRKGGLASLWGVAIVILFMFVYYRLTGLIADVALILNGALVLALMAALNSTLTLPGIAGFVLTLGMAVDANVLINERIREELRLGKTPRAAVDTGYDRAFSAIFDSHLTGIISSMVLMSQNASGPVRGFAVTLLVGLIISLFTSIVVTRAIVDYYVYRRGAQARLSV
jgi:preprotein translocase subunit SecD